MMALQRSIPRTCSRLMVDPPFVGEVAGDGIEMIPPPCVARSRVCGCAQTRGVRPRCKEGTFKVAIASMWGRTDTLLHSTFDSYDLRLASCVRYFCRATDCSRR